MDTLAKRLIWARERREMTQETLAKAAKVSQSTIGNLEAGIRLSSRKIAVLASVLGVDALWLSEGVGAPIADANENASVSHAPVLRLVSENFNAAAEMFANELVEVVSGYKNATTAERHAILQLSRSANARNRDNSGDSAPPG